MSDWNIDDDQTEAPRLPGKVQAIDRRLARDLQREAKYYTQMIPKVLADVGYDHWLRKESRPEPIERLVLGKTSRQMVKIMHAAYNEAAIYLRVDPLHLPYRVSIPMLKDEEILETLSVACGRKVTFQLRDYANGAWFVVARDGVLSSIPKLFPFKEAINAVPKSAGPLRFTAGVTENMRLVIPDIEKMPHMLVGGATRMGKSVFLHSVIDQILWRNSPADVQFLMIDLKGGMELQDYRNIPHLWRPIIKDIEGVVPALREYRTEMLRRQDLFAGKARSLPEYNRMRREKLPYIVMIIDELAQVLSNPQRELANDAMLELGLILAVARATGGHCIVCTQHPSVSVVSGYLKSNLDTRVAFKTATQSDSRVILDTSHAADIELPGRAWMLDGANRVQVQCPWISPTMIKRTVKTVIEREKQPAREEVDITKVVAISLERFGGSLAYRKLWQEPEVRSGISQHDLQDMLEAFDNEIVELDGKYYQVVPGNGASIPRHLDLVQFDEATAGGNGDR